MPSDNSFTSELKTKFTESRASISVVIPLYNHERYIEATIRSVLFQTITPTEIIVIDDGSSDHSSEIVRKLCQDHPEIIFWSWSNQGAHHTLNAGILRATGDFVAILNSDDIYEPERLAACLAVVQSDSSVDVVATGVSFLNGEGQYISNPWYNEALEFFKLEGDIALSLFHANFLVTTSNLFIKRSLFESIGFFAPLRYTHDLEFFLRLTLSKKNLYFLDRPLIAYRLHDSNTISENKIKSDTERASVLAFFLFKKWHENGHDEHWRTQFTRYIEILGQQDIIEIVENFLSLLETNVPQDGAPLITFRPTEFLSFLSLIGVDWVTPGARNPWLKRFTAARKSFKRRRKMGKLTSDKEWLIEQRNAWEKSAISQNEQAQTLIQALHADNAWLLEQRNAWEKSAISQNEQAQTLIQALHADNAWLLKQRNAWEHLADTSTKELVKHQSVLASLLRNRLFQFLVCAKLLPQIPMPDTAPHNEIDQASENESKR